MNKTQALTTTATFVGVAAGYAAGHGWLGLSVDDWTTVFGGIVAAGAVVVPAIVTRAKSLKDTVGKMPLTTVVTDKATADALPNNPDVIAATPAIVAAIKQGSDAPVPGLPYSGAKVQ
jgi:hypothetical protein